MTTGEPVEDPFVKGGINADARIGNGNDKVHRSRIRPEPFSIDCDSNRTFFSKLYCIVDKIRHHLAQSPMIAEKTGGKGITIPHRHRKTFLAGHEEKGFHNFPDH